MDRMTEANRYSRYGRTADRIKQMTSGRKRAYRGRTADQWFRASRASRKHAWAV